MRNFFDSLNARMATFMVGRYGTDQLNSAIFGVSIVMLIISMFGAYFLNTIVFVLLVWAMFRTFSRNHAARQAENEKYLKISAKPRAWWELLNLRWVNRKTTAYVKCPNCKKVFSLPKGKGKIRATCPHCHEQSIHNV